MKSYAEIMKVNDALLRVSAGWDTESDRVRITVEDLDTGHTHVAETKWRVAGYKSYNWCAERICDFEDRARSVSDALHPEARGIAIARLCATAIMTELPVQKDARF